MLYFLLAILIGYMLRLLGVLGVMRCIKDSGANREIKIGARLRLSALSYILGSVLRYTGILLTLATLVKTYIL